ncbi:Transposase IS66 family protein, partial [Succinivibrio dextrinosolvens]
LLNTLASESKLVQKNQQQLEENSRLSPKQFAYCDIGMMLPAYFNLKTATMFPVITGGKLTLGTVATFIFEHNFNNMPYSRIFSNFRHSGLKRSTAFAAIKAFDRLVLHKEAEIIRDKILKSHIIHADESQVHVRTADSEGRENRQFTCWQLCNSHLDEARYA